MTTQKTGLIILAAGESSRMGFPKQIAQYEGKTLLQRSIDAALEADLFKRVVVLGAFKDEIKKSFRADTIPVIHNPQWEKGMSSTMQKGLEYMCKFDKPDQVILMLCDQPFVDAELIEKLIAKQAETQKAIVACAYSNTYGVPMLFTEKYFEELRKLSGAEGAQKVAFQHEDDLATVDFPEGATDIDTEEDLKDLSV